MQQPAASGAATSSDDSQIRSEDFVCSPFTCNTPCYIPGRGWLMKSLGVWTFGGGGAKGFQLPLRFCETPPGLDELLVEWQPAPSTIAAQHTSSPRRNQLANCVTA